MAGPRVRASCATTTGMQVETRLALASIGFLALTPCAGVASAAVSVGLALAGLAIAVHKGRNAAVPLLALLASSGVFAVLLLIGILIALVAVLVVAAVAVVHSVPELSVWSPFGTGILRRLGLGDFWTTYRPELLVHHDGQENFFGGHCYLQWQTNGSECFDADSVLRFALEHGWTLHSRESLRLDEMNSWTPVCLLSQGKCNEPVNHAPGELSADYLGIRGPLRLDSDALFDVMGFDTGMYDHADLAWTRRSLVGFVSISADGRNLFVAHNWGE